MVRLSCLMTCCLVGAMLLVLPAAAYPSANNYYRFDRPEEIMAMLNRLNDLLQMERNIENFKEEITRVNREPMSADSNEEEISNAKRAFDMGLTRGNSGAIQAKHLMAMAAANYAGGPGRRRRNAH